MASSNVIRTAPSTRSAVIVLTLLAALLGAQLSAPLAATADETADERTSESAAAADRAAALLECTITGTRGDDVLVGGRGDDVLCGGGGDDVLRGGGGDDVLRGGGGEDGLFGGSGDDYLQGGRADDRLRAGAGDDDLRGGRGNDRLHARDADRFEDDLRCAEGQEDRAFADAGDFVSRTCEEPPRNAAPTDLALSPASVVENAVVGTEVGLLSVTDPDEGDTHTFTVVAGAGDADNASFVIDGRRQLSGAQGPAIQVAVDEEAARRVFPPQVQFRESGDAVGIGSGRAPSGGAEVWAVAYRPGLQTVTVAGGDNRGRAVRHVNVVQSLTRLGEWTGRPILLDLPAAADPADKVVVMVQSRADRRILSAAAR